MADNQYNFNAQAYLAANPDVAANAYYGANPYEHYINAGQKEGRQASFDAKPIELDPSQWGIYSGYVGSNSPFSEAPTLYQDPATGNVYNSNQEQRQLIASGNAVNDKYISGLGLSPQDSEELYQKSLSDPNGYTKDLMNRYSDIWYGNYGRNENERNISSVDPVLIELKQKDPISYYENVIGNFGRQMGWQVGQNTAGRIPAIQKELQKILPEALQSGLSQEQINNILNTGSNQGNRDNQQRIINEQQSGNFWKENLIGAAKVGALALGAYGLDTALGAGLAGAEAMGPTYAELGYVPTVAQAGGTAGAAGELMGPTYGELGYTGLEAGQMGPTYGELGYTGLNQGEAIAQADAASQLAQLKEYGSTAKDAYNNVNRAKKIADALTGNKNGQQSISPSVLASLLSTPQAQFGGLYRMNEHPFLSTQQTASLSPDSYNVSGQNITSPIAPTNQLLANLLYPKA